jgi:hypothetical protein
MVAMVVSPVEMVGLGPRALLSGFVGCGHHVAASDMTKRIPFVYEFPKDLISGTRSQIGER